MSRNGNEVDITRVSDDRWKIDSKAKTKDGEPVTVSLIRENGEWLFSDEGFCDARAAMFGEEMQGVVHEPVIMDDLVNSIDRFYQIVDHRVGGLMRALKPATKNCVPDETIREQIKFALEFYFPQVAKQEPPHDLELLICAGGPSIDRWLPYLRKRAGRKKTRVLAVNGSHDWLISKGLRPDYMIMLDPSPTMERFLGKMSAKTKYYLASMCHPDVWLRAGENNNGNIFQYHALVDAGEQAVLEDKNENTPGGFPWALIAGGGTAATRAVNLFYFIGFRRFTFFGLDSSFDDFSPEAGGFHVYPQDDLTISRKINVFFNGRPYNTDIGLATQAEQFQGIIRLFRDCEFSMCSDGLLGDICKQWRIKKEYKNGRK